MRERVRVTADSPRELETPRPLAQSREAARSGHSIAEPEAVYVYGLMRAQLKLAFGCLVGFLATAGSLAVLLTTMSVLNEVILWGVPLSWLLHAFGFYPVIFVFALIYATAARRNERRFRALKESVE